MPTDYLSAIRARYGVLAAAILVSALCQIYIVSRSPIIAKDGIGFIHIAKCLAIDPVTTMRAYDQHPGYPAMLLVCERVSQWLTAGDDFQSFVIASRIASGVCGLGTILFLWLFARRLYDEPIANLTVLLAAVWPLFRLNAGDSLSDTPHLMFYLAGAWLACEGLCRRRGGWFAAAGIASGLAFWIRPEGLAVAAAAAAALVAQLGYALVRQRWQASAASQNEPCAKPAWAFTFWALGALLATAALTIAPYVVFAGKLTSKKLPFAHAPPSAHAVVIATAEPTAGLLSEPGPSGQLPGEFRRPSKLPEALALGIVELFRELAKGFYYLALIPLGAGTFLPGRQVPAPRGALLHVMLMNAHATLLMLLFLTAGYISHRHLMPLVALMLPTMAAGALLLAGFAARWLPSLARPRHAAAAVVAIFYVGLLPKCLVPVQTVYQPVYQAALWVKSQAQPGENVLSTSGYVRFYTDLPGILVGSEAPNLPTAFFLAPNGKWSYVVLEIDDRCFNRQDLCKYADGYEQVMELDAHPRKPWAKVAVFRAHKRDATAQVAARPGVAN